MMSSWRVIGTSPMKYGRVVLKNFVALCASVGFQIQFAIPIIENSNDTVTTSFTVSVVPCKPRKIATSKNAPNNGPRTSNTTAIDSGAGQFHSKRSCQYANAPSMPMAPCAKLKTPVVVYVSTRPLAATARIAARERPVIV